MTASPQALSSTWAASSSGLASSDGRARISALWAWGVSTTWRTLRATLKNAVESALGGQGSLVMVVGEPGIGKTRLAEEAGVYARLRGAQVLVGRCYVTEAALCRWADYHTTLTATVVDQATDAEGRTIRRAKATPESVIRVYLELDNYAPEEDALPYVREVCGEWLEHFALGAYVEKAGAALDRGDLEKAREALSAGLSPVAREREGVRLSEFVGRPLPKPAPGAVPTGLYELDRLWGGGIRPGERPPCVRSSPAGHDEPPREEEAAGRACGGPRPGSPV